MRLVCGTIGRMSDTPNAGYASVQERNAKSVLAEANRLIRDYHDEQRAKDVEMRSHGIVTAKGPKVTYEDLYFADLDEAADHVLNVMGLPPERHASVRKIIEHATHSGAVSTRARFVQERAQWIRMVRNLSGNLAYVAALAIANGRWARNEHRARLRHGCAHSDRSTDG